MIAVRTRERGRPSPWIKALTPEECVELSRERRFSAHGSVRKRAITNIEIDEGPKGMRNARISLGDVGFMSAVRTDGRWQIVPAE